MLGALVTLIALLTLTSCSIYDPDILPRRSKTGGSAGGPASGDGGVAESGKKDSHVNVDGEAGDADQPETGDADTGDADTGGALECPVGFGNCDGDGSNGCETKLDTLTDCGDCGQPCDGVSCAGGVCTDLTCDKGYAACDGKAGNGCETSLTSRTDCVMCNTSCEYDNAIADCSEGSCELVQCKSGYDDCDKDLSNGCETPLDTLTDCGACDTVCTVDRGTPNCAGGICTAESCDSGHADCDAKADNGCETELGTVNACSGCGDDCTALDNVSQVSCEQDGCHITSCAGDYLDCDENPLNGCEHDSAGTGSCCDMQSDSDTDGVNDCEDECPTDPDRGKKGQCGCPSEPAAAGESCTDGVCGGSAQCDGAGNCGNPDDCPPDDDCIFKTYTAQTSKGYFFCIRGRGWIAARDRCRAVGMELLRVDDAVENAFVAANIGSDTWIGGSDLTDEDQWRWAENGVDDGEQFWQGKVGGSAVGGLFSNWSFGEPSGSDEDCAEVRPSGFWNDDQCDHTGAYVCEKRAD